MTKKFTSGILSAAIAVAALGMSGGVAEAATWQFKNGPTGDGWVLDKTVQRPNGATLGVVNFGQSDLTTSRPDGPNDRVIVLKSSDRTRNNLRGGGIERPNTFNTGRMRARCRMRGSNAEIKRSQASFWLDVAGPNTVEIDVFEIKPQGNYLNYITWANAQRVPQNQPASATHRWGSHAQSRTWRNYACTTGNRRNFRCTNGQASHNWTKQNISTVGNTVIVHNKPWRFGPNNSNIGFGKVGDLECDWVRN